MTLFRSIAVLTLCVYALICFSMLATNRVMTPKEVTEVVGVMSVLVAVLLVDSMRPKSNR
jgi:hypothetical protein